MNDIEIFKFEEIKIPTLNEKKNSRKDWIDYGDENNYPKFLYDLYCNCSDHQSIIDGVVNYVVGNGMISNNTELSNFFKKVNNDGENIDDILKKVELDFQIFGGFSLQIIPNKKGGLAEIYWIDFMKCRLNEDKTLVYYSHKWKKYDTDYETYEIFNGKNLNKTTIFYYSGAKTRGVYPIPLYNGGIRSISTAIEIDKFHLNNISNGFQVSTLIQFNNGDPLPEQKLEIEKKIKEKFNGTNGQKLMTIFNESKDKGVTVEKLDADNFGDQFVELSKNTKNNIFTSHKITSPALFGVTIENQGFSKTEFEESFDIFNQTVIKTYQNIMIKEFTKIFSNFYTDTSININPYTLSI